jgi:hypothetical protein
MRRILFAGLCAALFLGSADRVRDGADLHISFAGLICHVFDAQHAPRAVMVRGTAAMPHRATMVLSERQIAATDVALSCSNGECSVDLQNTAVKFLHGGRASFEPGGSFDRIVPHLQAVTNGEMNALRDEVFDDVPSPGNVIAAYFELPSGALTAVPFAQTASFDPDYENRGLRPFPQGVFLSGHVAQPELLIRRAGDARWSHIRFRAGSTIDIRVSNEPVTGGDAMHEMLYYGLSKNPLVNQPVVAAGTSPGIGARVVVPGCSDTQWP